MSAVADKQFLTLREAADEIGVTYAAVWAWAQAGAIKASAFPRGEKLSTWRVHRSVVNELLTKKAQGLPVP